MKRFMIGVVCLILVAGFGASARAQQPSPTGVVGEWAGGYEIRGYYTPIRVRFNLEGAGIKGTLDFPQRGRTGFALDQVRLLSPNLHFEWPGGGGPAQPVVFEGQLSGDSITGSLQYNNGRGTFHLVHSVTLDAKILEQYAGDYEIGRNSYVSIWLPPAAETPTGIMYSVRDLSSPDHRSGNLFPVSETAFVAGPGRWVPYPVEINAAFIKNKQGQVTGLKWKPTGSPEVTAKKVKLHLHDEEQVKFSNGDVTLAARLVLPLTKGPHPAVVIISGSDGGGRWKGFGLPVFFAQHGIAALTYDKRGWEESTGTRIGATVEDMAGDAAAGIRFLQKRPDIDPSKVGVWAISQGGWMAPVVATTTPNVAFMILHAGPAVSPRLQGRMELVNSYPSRYNLKQDELNEAVQYQNLYFDAMNSDEAYDKVQASYQQLIARGVRWAWNPGTKEQLRAQWTRPNVDFDPVPFLEKVQCPVLAFFGGKDGLVPPEGNVAIMEAALRKAGNKDVTIKVLPGVNHLMQLPGWGSYGYQSSGKTPPGYYDVMIPWLKKRVNLQ
jgi:pimeloyl-ACP methyl ester carboxylesterase